MDEVVSILGGPRGGSVDRGGGPKYTTIWLILPHSPIWPRAYRGGKIGGSPPPSIGRGAWGGGFGGGGGGAVGRGGGPKYTTIWLILPHSPIWPRAYRVVKIGVSPPSQPFGVTADRKSVV